MKNHSIAMKMGGQTNPGSGGRHRMIDFFHQRNGTTNN
jgi:hypothetical protein